MTVRAFADELLSGGAAPVPPEWGVATEAYGTHDTVLDGKEADLRREWSV